MGLQWGIAVAAALVSLRTDVASFRIPNWLTFPLLLGGLVFAFTRGQFAGLGDSFAGCLIMAFPYVLLFIFARGGAGDAKLMGALGAWLGIYNGLIALACVAACGIILALIHAALKNRARQVASNVIGMAHNLLLAVVTRGRLTDSIMPADANEPMLVMPYGVAIFTGVCVAAAGVLLWRV